MSWRCPLLAQSGHHLVAPHMSAFDPKRTLGLRSGVCHFSLAGPSQSARLWPLQKRVLRGHMKHRKFIALLGGAAAWPLAARAQQPERMRRIGLLMASSADHSETQARMAAFQQGLAQLGWTDGRNVRIDTRWATTNADDLRRHATELAALAPDVLVAANGSSTVAPLLQATRTVPIVFVIVVDPVGAGFVTSLARPGGNATGFLMFEYGLSGKWLELLKQIAPGVTRAVVLRDPAIASGIGQFAAVQAVAAFAQSGNGGVIVTPSPVANLHRGLIARLMDRHRSARGLRRPPVRHCRRPDLLRARPDRPGIGARPATWRLPAIYQWPEMAEDEGLLGSMVLALSKSIAIWSFGRS